MSALRQVIAGAGGSLAMTYCTQLLSAEREQPG